MLNVTQDDSRKKPPGSESNLSLFTVAHTAQARRAVAWLEDRVKKSREVGIFTEVVDLTPVLAELLLGRNSENRALRANNLDQITRDIREGRWELNGEFIKISTDGELNDGQHRCHAVIDAGRSIPILATFGIDRSTRSTLDQGATRTTGDYLSMDGVPHANHTASVAAMVWQAENNGKLSRSQVTRPTKAQVLETYAANQMIGDSIRAIPFKGSTVLGGVSVLAFCHFMMSRKNKAEAEKFFDRLIKGDNLKIGDPVYVCREALRQRERLTTAEKTEMIFTAWNAYRRGRSLKQIKVLGSLPSLER